MFLWPTEDLSEYSERHLHCSLARSAEGGFESAVKYLVDVTGKINLRPLTAAAFVLQRMVCIY